MFAMVIAASMWMAQDDNSARVTELVTRLVANGQIYEQTLPSVSCEQTVHSQAVHKGKIKRETTSDGTLTIQRTGNHDEPFKESYHWKTVNGKDVPEGRGPRNPYFVHGIFSNALGFSSMDILQCDALKLTEEPGGTELRLEIERKPGTETLPACVTPVPGQRRTVYIDRASGHVLRLFRTVPGEQAKQVKDTAYASVEYRPVKLGADTFWLPVRGEARDDKDEGRMQVDYSGCHRYASTVTITGGTDVVPEAR